MYLEIKGASYADRSLDFRLAWTGAQPSRGATELHLNRVQIRAIARSVRGQQIYLPPQPQSGCTFTYTLIYSAESVSKVQSLRDCLPS